MQTPAGEYKVKEKMIDVSEVLDEVFDAIDDYVSSLSIHSLLEMSIDEEYQTEDASFKLLMDKGETGTKFKAQMKTPTTEGEIILVYDATNKMIANRLYVSETSEYMNAEIEMEIKPYTGKVRLPGDLDTYTTSII